MTDEKDVAYVYDTLAVAAPRRHGIVLANGLIKNYDLRADEATEMPHDHAMRFLCDASFVVKDAEGNVLRPVAKKEQMTHVQIPAGFVLAELAELSRDALFVRCKLCAGSEHIHPKKTSAAEMVEFLVAAAPAAKAAIPELGELELGASPDELDKMFS